MSAAWFAFFCPEQATAFAHIALAQYLATPVAADKTLLNNKHQLAGCFFAGITFHG
jgi:hypothetical protein